MTFPECVTYCAGVPELVQNFDRLRGTHLAQINHRAPLDIMVDNAIPDRYDEDCRKFIDFVWEMVWTRLPDEAFGDAP